MKNNVKGKVCQITAHMTPVRMFLAQEIADSCGLTDSEFADTAISTVSKLMCLRNVYGWRRFFRADYWTLIRRVL